MASFYRPRPKRSHPRIRVGDHAYLPTTGDYLGLVTGVGKAVVRLADHTRDGHPTLATVHEISVSGDGPRNTGPNLPEAS